MRAVIDTNVWVSAVLNRTGPPAAIRAAFVEGQFDLVMSEPLLAELADVLTRPRLTVRYGLTAADSTDLLTLLRARSALVEVSGAVRLCRDPNDDIVIETALNGRADALVTPDDDLKGVAELADLLAERGLAVMTVRQFLAALGSRRPG